MDMQEFERNRRKKKENTTVNHVNVNSSINKRDFINYNPFLNKTNVNVQDEQEDLNAPSEAEIIKEALSIAKSSPLAETFRPNEGTFVNEGTPKSEGAFVKEGTPKSEGAFKNEGTLKMKVPKKVEIDLNSVVRMKASIDSLRFEQVVRQVVMDSKSNEVIIGRRVFESNGVNKARFTSAREETKDRGIIDYGVKRDEKGIEFTWYRLR